jgi:hypothetical protein
MQFLIVVLGFGSAAAAALAASRIATRAGRRPGAAFGLSAFFLAGLGYVAALQALVLYGLPHGLLPVPLAPETTFLIYAALTSALAVALGAGLVAAWIAVSGASRAAPSRFKAFGLAALFSLAVGILAAPFLIQNQLAIGRAVSANESEIQAYRTSYKAGLEKLATIGALHRIDVDDDAVTHYIGGPLYQVGAKGLAEYARAAMVYQTLVLGADARPVVLRDAITEDRIATYSADGVFVVQTTRDLDQSDNR